MLNSQENNFQEDTSILNLEQNNNEDQSIPYKSTCLELFNIPFKKYREKKQKEKTAKDLENPYHDYDIFYNIVDGFEILGEFLKYAVWYNKDNWKNNVKLFEIKSPQDLYELEVKLPETIDELELIFKSYPYIIDDLNPEIYNIINLENYDLMYKLSKIKKFLYFNTFPEVDDAQYVLKCEDDSIELWTHLKLLVKKLMVHHLKLAKTKNK
jgi:hypothetical protein